MRRVAVSCSVVSSFVIVTHRSRTCCSCTVGYPPPTFTLTTQNTFETRHLRVALSERACEARDFRRSMFHRTSWMH
ncbi:hypothetical protein GY45DRAFT_755011 [Cubamyces sp. BRFM 1775]|nr:hypothetical protein GY45DRAFT_755011 [Cubamyces sp. BRFM 1775]